MGVINIKDKKLDQCISSKGGSTWTCTKRIVITGYHMDGDVMVMEASIIDVCRYSYTPVKPRVDHLDVYTDGMEGGGGGDDSEEEEEEYEGSPCEKLKLQNANANYKGKIAELTTPTVLNDSIEHGYVENNNGSFDLPTASHTGEHHDGLSINVSPTTKGFIHNHRNDYETKNKDSDGNPIIKMPIRIFSPADINTFMIILQTAVSNGTDLNNIYATMVSSSGNYTLKFNGDISNIVTGFGTDFCRDHYLNYFNNKRGTTEKKFLKFMKEEMNIEGVELYRINNDGSSTLYKLSANGNRVERIDCPK